MTEVKLEEVVRVLEGSGELAPGARGEELEQIQGGWSRHTYIARIRAVDGSESRHVVRVRPPGALLDTELELEYQVYEALDTTSVPTPRVQGIELSPETPFGGQFFVMEFLPGSPSNIYSRDDQQRLAEDWDGSRGVANDMVETLAEIHKLDVTAMPARIQRLSYLDVVAKWKAVYDERKLVRDPIFEEGFDWLLANQPKDQREGLVHGDYRIGNTLVADGRLTAVLDWELVYVGDVRFDLGYLVLERSAGKHLRRRAELMGTFADEAWFLERYGSLTGNPVEVESLRPFQLLSIMMLVATQVTAVWMHANGKTDDFRMVWARYSLPGLRDDMVRLMKW